MIAKIRHCVDGDKRYDILYVWCPACDDLHGLPVNTTEHTPAWDWNGNLEAPTLTPSILSNYNGDPPRVCHSYLTDGVWNFLSDCTHAMAGQQVPSPPLPEWFLR